MSESLTYPRRTARARPGSHPIRADDGVRHCHRCLFALGAYVGHHLSNGAGFVAFITAFGCLIAMRFAPRRSAPLAVVLLSAFRVLTRLALGDDAGVLCQREPAGAVAGRRTTALHIAGLGAAGYATRLDLTRYGLLSMAGSGSSSRTMPATCAGFRPSCLVWPRAVTCCWGRTPQC
jgi:hypothetical protein